jgi:hypothetical protein
VVAAEDVELVDFSLDVDLSLDVDFSLEPDFSPDPELSLEPEPLVDEPLLEADAFLLDSRLSVR